MKVCDVEVMYSSHASRFSQVTIAQNVSREDDSATIGGGEKANGYEPRLLRFLGRPDDITPKALAKMVLGHPLPFDRHDWVVDRGGDEVMMSP